MQLEHDLKRSSHLLYTGSCLHCDLLGLLIDIQDTVQQGQAEHALTAEGQPVGGQCRPHAAQLLTCKGMYRQVRHSEHRMVKCKTPAAAASAKPTARLLEGTKSKLATCKPPSIRKLVNLTDQN